MRLLTELLGIKLYLNIAIGTFVEIGYTNHDRNRVQQDFCRDYESWV